MANAITASAYSLAHEEGTMVNYFGALVVIKANAEMTNGSFGLSEYWAREGSSAPWHVHHEADEMYYVLDGEVVGYARDEDREETLTTVPTGGTHYIPKRTDHTFKIASEEAKMLILTYEPKFEDWFIELGEPVETYELPPAESPEENEQKANAVTPELCERFDIEITGPPPA